MEVNFVDADTPDFDAQNYLRVLVAIAKSDKENGPREFDYIRNLAQRMDIDPEPIMRTTDKNFFIAKQKVSRLTALMILKDALALASLDRNITLPERQRIYTCAEQLDIPRKDVDALEALIQAYRSLDARWRQLVSSR